MIQLIQQHHWHQCVHRLPLPLSLQLGQLVQWPQSFQFYHLVQSFQLHQWVPLLQGNLCCLLDLWNQLLLAAHFHLECPQVQWLHFHHLHQWLQ